MIELDIRSLTKNPTPTPSVVKNPTPRDSGSATLDVTIIYCTKS